MNELSKKLSNHLNNNMKKTHTEVNLKNFDKKKVSLDRKLSKVQKHRFHMKFKIISKILRLFKN